MESKVRFDSTDKQAAFLEALLFVSSEPVQAEKIMEALGIEDIIEFEKLIEYFEVELENGTRGLSLKRAGGGYQFVTKGIMHEPLKEFFTIRRSSKLSVASLETLAIIAYRQPCTIAEISELRGVNSVGPVKNLLQKKLIKLTGRKKVPGNPSLYSTSKEFLLYFGLDSIKELPSLEELTEMFEEKEQPSLFQ